MGDQGIDQGFDPGFDPGFVWEFVGKVGAPVFAATLVACLLSGKFEPLHGVLMAVGLAMMALSHWRTHHR